MLLSSGKLGNAKRDATTFVGDELIGERVGIFERDTVEDREERSLTPEGPFTFDL